MKTVCGLDLDKSMILMCILQTNGAKVIQEFSTLTVDVESMRDLMKEHCVEEVGMEMRIYCEKYFKKELLLLCTIPDIQLLSAMIINAELGVDLRTFAPAHAQAIDFDKDGDLNLMV